jgi:transcriptional regulator with XRE-family HTH domain
MGLQRSSVTRWANGSAPRKATVEKIATYFGVDSKELTGEEQKEKPAPGEGSGLDADVKAKAYTILDKLSKLPTKQQEAFLNSLDISIDAALNMMDGNG